MKRGMVVAAVVAAFALSAGAAQAQGEKKPQAPTKLDLEALFRKLDVDGDGKISLEEFKKLEEFYKPMAEPARKGGKGGRGNFDPEKIKKLIEKFGGEGNIDPDTIKKFMEKFKGKGGIDPEQLKKLKDKIGGKVGVNFDLEHLQPFIEQFLPANPGVAADPGKKAALQ